MRQTRCNDSRQSSHGKTPSHRAVPVKNEYGVLGTAIICYGNAAIEASLKELADNPPLHPCPVRVRGQAHAGATAGLN